MRIAMHELRSLIGSLVMEAEGGPPACDVKFVEGETLKLHRAVRVIPLEGGGFFGGEPRVAGRAARARGASVKELPPGTECKILKRIGGRAAWVQVEGIKGPIRMDINKFCPTRAGTYLAGKKKRKAKDVGPPTIMSPEDELAAAEREHDEAAAAFASAAERLEQARAAITPAGEMEDDTPVD